MKNLFPATGTKVNRNTTPVINKEIEARSIEMTTSFFNNMSRPKGGFLALQSRYCDWGKDKRGL